MTDTRSPRPMAPPFPARSVFFALVASLAAFAVILNGYGSVIVKQVEQFYSDFRTSLLSDRIAADHERVVIVSVGEGATSRGVNLGQTRTDVDRSMLARLIDVIDENAPRAIGLDIVLRGAGERSRDEALQRALREAKAQVVIGVRPDTIVPGSDRWRWTEQFMQGTGRRIGHISAIREGDRVVGFDAPELAMGRIPDSFATLMARAQSPTVRTSFGPIAWLQRVDDSSFFSRIFNIAGQQPFRVLYADDLLDSSKPSPTRLLVNKLVIVTSGLGEIDGRLRTPLTAWSNETVAPIQVQAQAIAQLVDGRTAGALPARTNRTLLFAIACIGGLVGWYRSRGWNIGGLVLSILFLLVLDSAFYAWFNIQLPVVEGVAVWVLAEIAGRQLRRILQWEEAYGKPWPIPGTEDDVVYRPRPHMADVVRTAMQQLKTQIRQRDR